MDKKEFDQKLFELMMEYLDGKLSLQYEFYKDNSCNILSGVIIKKYFTYKGVN